jgi:hypothetical protein
VSFDRETPCVCGEMLRNQVKNLTFSIRFLGNMALRLHSVTIIVKTAYSCITVPTLNFG